MKEIKEDVLGTEYIVRLGEREEIDLVPEFIGECGVYEKTIKVLHSAHAEDRELDDEARDVRTKEIVVHEVCHAFLNESGVRLENEVEEQVCDFLMKNYWKMNNVILDILDRSDLID